MTGVDSVSLVSFVSFAVQFLSQCFGVLAPWRFSPNLMFVAASWRLIAVLIVCAALALPVLAHAQTLPRAEVLGISFDRVGLGYPKGSDGLRGVRLVGSFPF